jgi:putative ABC transport system ATP-binding protein
MRRTEKIGNWSEDVHFCCMPGNTTLLRAERLRREVDGRAVVREANFTLRSGEVVAITGPSGAGKSSLLRLLNRLDEATGGTVWLLGQDTREIEVRELRRRVGLVMQDANLFPGTVAANVAYGPSLKTAPASGLDAAAGGSEQYSFGAGQVEELLATVGLTGYADRDVAALSGGEAQRVSLARTLANQPQVLLLDEPTSALDEAAKRVVEEALRAAMARVEGACLLVTHDAAQAERLAHRTLTMQDGVLHEADRCEEAERGTR